MIQLIIIRGASGSGKSTLAKSEFSDHEHFEADMYFEKNGEYLFDDSKIQQAHLWCQQRVKAALRKGKKVVVSNTFVRLWEMKPYIDFGYPYSVIEVEGRFPNKHGVPKETVERMRARFEPYQVSK